MTVDNRVQAVHVIMNRHDITTVKVGGVGVKTGKKQKKVEDPGVLLRRAKRDTRLGICMLLLIPLWFIPAAIIHPIHKARLEAARTEWREVRDRSVYVEMLRTEPFKGVFSWEDREYEVDFAKVARMSDSSTARRASAERAVGTTRRIRIDPDNLHAGIVRSGGPKMSRQWMSYYSASFLAFVSLIFSGWFFVSANENREKAKGQKD